MIFFEGVVEGYHKAEAELSDFGVSVHLIINRGYNVNVHLETIDRLLEAGCMTLCLTTIDVPPIREKINDIISRGIPVIAVNTDVSDTNRLCCIGSNYLQGGQVAAALLAKWSGFGKLLRVLIVTGSITIKGHNERIEGFEQTLRAKGVRFNVEAVHESLDENEYAYHVAKTALAEHPEINCVFIAGGGAAGTCMAIRDSGIRERHALSIISFDDVESTKAMILSGDIDFTICQEPQLQGYQAVSEILNYFLSNKMAALRISTLKSLSKRKRTFSSLDDEKCTCTFCLKHGLFFC